MVGWQIALPLLSGATALGLGAWVTQRLLSYRSLRNTPETLSEVTPEGTEATSSGFSPVFSPVFSMDRYQPMARLLDSEDLRFLASLPGYRREMGARLRNSRRRIFRMYLAELSADFQGLHAAARRIVSEAPEQHADLVRLLMLQQIKFWRALAAIELRLALSWAGLAPANARGLVELVEQLQQALTAAAPASATA